MNYSDSDLQPSRATSAHTPDSLVRVALRAAQVGAWDWNLVTGEEHWSMEVENIFGLPPSSTPRNYDVFLNCIHPDDRPLVEAAQERTLAEGVDYHAEYRVLHAATGEIRWVESWGNVLRGQYNEPLILTGLCMDITERKQMQETMLRNERLLLRQSRTLAQLARNKAIADGDLLTALQLITEASAQTLEVARVGVWLYNSQRTNIRCLDLYERAANQHTAGNELAEADYPIYFHAIRRARMLAIRDVGSDPDTSELATIYLLPRGVNAMIDVPIWVGGQLVGIICHEHVGPPRDWMLTEQNFVASIADFAALAIQANDRKQAMLAARTAQEEQSRLARQIQLLLESAGEGIYGMDCQGRCTFINQAALTMLGYSLAEVIGRNISTLVHPSYSDGRPYLREDYPAFKTMVSGQGCRLDNEVFWRKDGSSFIVEYTANPIVENGQILGSVVSFTDVTERRLVERVLLETQQKLSLYFQQTSLAAIEWDLSFRVVAWNPAAEIIFGYSAEEALGQNGLTLLVPEDRRPVVQRLWQDILAQSPSTRSTHENLTKNGQLIICDWYNTVLVNDQNQVVGVISLAQDITDRKRAEEELFLAKEAAEAANLAKSQFLANMSHELRTPLNAIIGYSEMLQEDAEAMDLQDFVCDLQKIQTSGRHLLGLINDILDLSKIEAGHMELVQEEFSIGRLIQEVALTIQPLVEKNNNQLLINCPDNIGNMWSDSTRLRQNLLNLLSNAAKFTHQGQITLTVICESYGAAESPHSADLLSFQIMDTGIGMTPQQMQRIFQPFTQADPSTTRKYGGTGLGLTITQKLCQMMGGSISVKSELGEGSTFTMQLPREIQKVTQEVAPPLIVADTAPMPKTASLMLVIDNDRTTRDLLLHLLNRQGYRVVTAWCGEEGLRLAKELQPDLITLDIMMPGMDGWSVLAALKKDPETRSIPVVLTTIVEDPHLGYDLGASDYLTKPINREQLSQILKRHNLQPMIGRLLVVEDDLNHRQMLGQMLIKEGWQIREAENDNAALAAIATETPHLILLDLAMDDRDGFWVLNSLQNHPEWNTIPIVIISGRELSQDEKNQLPSQVAVVLQKGAYRREELLRWVRSLLIKRIGY